MIVLATYCSDNMTISAGKLAESASKHGVDKTLIYTEESLSDDFKAHNKDVLSQPRGAGYWIWKPYIIYQTMMLCNSSDIIIYSDAGILFENNINLLIEEMTRDVMLFGHVNRHGDWIKRDCVIAMGYDEPEYLNKPHAQASVIICRNGPWTQQLIKEWMLWVQFPSYLDDSPSYNTEYPSFKEHRHDQSILTNLSFRFGIELHWWPVQYMLRHKNKYNDNYPVMFQHHRKRNDEW